MKSFVTYCGASNIDIMSIENEPDYAQSITYEGCGWSAQNFLDFCKTYAPQIGKPIMLPESFSFNYALSDPTLNDSLAAKNVSYVGGHLYGGMPRNPYTLAINKGKHVWETEHYITNDGASQCMSVAKEIMDCMNVDMSAYVWWWMTYSAGEGLYYNGALQHRGWVLGQFSKWVRPGYIRVDATYNPQTGVNVVAFRGTQNVIVAMNSNTSAQSVTFTFTGATVTSAHKYTSSQTKSGTDDGTINATNNSFTTTLDPQSVSTFVSAGTVPIIYNPESRSIETNRTMTAASNFIYLVNGRRLNLPYQRATDKSVPNIYIMPGQSRVGLHGR
jgi:glucuronoarabinoxylan endo-1,4-beta-xylanase